MSAMLYTEILHTNFKWKDTEEETDTRRKKYIIGWCIKEIIQKYFVIVDQGRKRQTILHKTQI